MISDLTSCAVEPRNPETDGHSTPRDLPGRCDRDFQSCTLTVTSCAEGARK